jgi:hypothetical protein
MYFLCLSIIFLPALISIWWLIGFGCMAAAMFSCIYAILGRHFATAFLCDCVLAFLPPFDPVLALRGRMKERFYTR